MTSPLSSPRGAKSGGLNGPDLNSAISGILTEARESDANDFGMVLTQISTEAEPALLAQYSARAEGVSGPTEERVKIANERTLILSEAMNSGRMSQAYCVFLMPEATRQGDDNRHKNSPDPGSENIENAPITTFLTTATPLVLETRLVAGGKNEASVIDAASDDSIVEERSPFDSTQSQLPPVNISLIEIETHLPPLIIQALDEHLTRGHDLVRTDIFSKAPQIIAAPVRILKIVLHPAELGALNLRIRMSGSGMQVEIRAETGGAAARLSQVREKLLENLMAAGAEIREADLRIGVLTPQQPNDQPQILHHSGERAFGADERRGAFTDRRPYQKNRGSPDEKLVAPDSSEPMGVTLHDGMFV